MRVWKPPRGPALREYQVDNGQRGGQAPALRKKTPPLHVGRGPVPRHRFGIRTHHPCRSGSPDPDLFGSGRSRTTEVGPMASGIRQSPRGDKYRNGVMKHPRLNLREPFRMIRRNPLHSPRLQLAHADDVINSPAPQRDAPPPHLISEFCRYQ